MTSVAPLTRREDLSAGHGEGPGFYVLCQRAPIEAAMRLLVEVVGSGEPPDLVSAPGPDWRRAVRVASALTGLDVRSREDPSLLDLFKALVGVSSRWAHEAFAGDALVAAIRLLRLRDASDAVPGWPVRSETGDLDLAAFERESRAVGCLLTRRCGRVAVVTHDNYDEDAYLLANPDVRNALQPDGMAVGFDHFRIFGHAEGRKMRVFRTARP